IQDLSDHPRFPEQPAIEPLAVLAKRLLEARQHAQAEKAVAGDVLIAREPTGGSACVDWRQEIQAVGHRFPQVLGTYRGPRVRRRVRVASRPVETRVYVEDGVNRCCEKQLRL